MIEMPPLQQPNQTPTPAANPALSRLAPRPSRGRDNPERNTGSGSAADRNQHPGESPPLHAADASILHDEESTSEHFFDAEDSITSSDTSSIAPEQPAPRDPPVHPAAAAAAATATAAPTRTERLGALAASIGTGAVRGASTVLGPTASAVLAAARGIPEIKFDGQYLGAALGHLVHQATSVGPTTFARELLGQGLFAALRQLPPEAVVAMQAVSGTLQMALHTLRSNRENRNPDAAARGFHNLSLEQWDALSDAERTHKKAEQRHYSDLVTRLALGGIVSNIAVGAAGKASGQPEVAARLLASDLKIAAYAAARDTIQATFRMVGMGGPTNGGISGAHFTAAGRFYGMANVLTNLASNEVASPDFATAQQRWAGLNSPFKKGQATDIIVCQSAVSAALNVCLETLDWLNVTQHEADEAGTQQFLDPAFKGKRHDYERVMDQSITRTAAINSNIALGTAVNMIGAWVGLSPAPSALLSNTVSGVVAGMQYKIIGATWQAEAAVREAEAHRSQVE
ncbi:hypothetical protein E1J29_16640 [Xanthomonas hortorum pv. vitians]|nr:hypothetical protein [Xanthomonas hortorum pv. vitians]QEW14103.1 hypothetical protein DYQ48_02850 [Xanthomonas hortorum]NMI26176.1 hypothetical protein [Xanthomonas hortorum pv. vitians]NMI32119.1 hypothetical protein [Xanthomonas hortorum pv. vitians]NMI34864.1 hypothetical protein [Xanthomonas hortorum pv. vitians]